MRAFAYCRVSTGDQTTKNQMLEIAQKGFDIEPHRIITEVVSGSTPAANRKGFQSLLQKLEKGDKLIVTKLDRLGRDSIDVQQTIKSLTDQGIEVHCIALANVDLSTAIGTMMLNMISAFAQFERDLLIERTHAGLERARSEGKTLGRPKSLTDDQKEEIRLSVESTSALSKRLGVSRATVMRARAE